MSRGWMCMLCLASGSKVEEGFRLDMEESGLEMRMGRIVVNLRKLVMSDIGKSGIIYVRLNIGLTGNEGSIVLPGQPSVDCPLKSDLSFSRRRLSFESASSVVGVRRCLSESVDFVFGRADALQEFLQRPHFHASVGASQKEVQPIELMLIKFDRTPSCMQLLAPQVHDVHERGQRLSWVS